MSPTHEGISSETEAGRHPTKIPTPSLTPPKYLRPLYILRSPLAARCWSRPALRRFPCSLSLRAQRRWTAPPLPRGPWTRCAMASFVNQGCSSRAAPAGTRREPDAQVGASSSTGSGGQWRHRRKRRGSRGLFAGSCACTPRDRHRDLGHLVLIQARGVERQAVLGEPPGERH